jgi:hypothetical protein
LQQRALAICGRPFFAISSSADRPSLRFFFDRAGFGGTALGTYSLPTGDERSHGMMMVIRKARGAVGLMVLGSVVLLGTPTLAVEPGAESSAGPELPASRTDQVGAIFDPESKGADPSVAPDVVINEPATPLED